jgi:hypothetical protein
MKECAFCPDTANLTGEHIFSDWMNDLLPGRWDGTFTSADGSAKNWSSVGLDLKAKVVCDRCNNGWMSDLEGQHAQPILTPLIEGKSRIPISQSAARSIAVFAFKTAVIIDHVRKDKGRAPFFSRRLRTAFRKHLEIPSAVQMWMCSYSPGIRRADYFAGYYDGEMAFVGPLQLYICTYGIGGFAFQVLAAKQRVLGTYSQGGRFEKLAVPFWPQIPLGFIWPVPSGLRSVQEIIEFHGQWNNLGLR